jgi:hypothetical protein
MVKNTTIVLLVILAILLPFSVKGGIVSPGSSDGVHAASTTMQDCSTSDSACRVLLPSIMRNHARLAPSMLACPWGAGTNKQSVEVLKLHSGLAATKRIQTAELYFPQLAKSHRSLMAPSLAGLHDLAVQSLAAGIPFESLSYDLEGWELTPPEERDDPVEAARLARIMAHGYGKQLVMGPAAGLTRPYWPDMVPHADWWVLQAQGAQKKYPALPDFKDAVCTLANEVRQANPNIPIWAQLSTSPVQSLTVPQFRAYASAIMPSCVDGIFVYNPDGQSIAPIFAAACGQ